MVWTKLSLEKKYNSETLKSTNNSEHAYKHTHTHTNWKSALENCVDYNIISSQNVCFYMCNKIIYHSKSVERWSVEAPNKNALCMQCRLLFSSGKCIVCLILFFQHTKFKHTTKLTIVLYLFYLISTVILHFVRALYIQH